MIIGIARYRKPDLPVRSPLLIFTNVKIGKIACFMALPYAKSRVKSASSHGRLRNFISNKLTDSLVCGAPLRSIDRAFLQPRFCVFEFAGRSMLLESVKHDWNMVLDN
jgi:hypothetical protein